MARASRSHMAAMAYLVLIYLSLGIYYLRLYPNWFAHTPIYERLLSGTSEMM